MENGNFSALLRNTSNQTRNPAPMSSPSSAAVPVIDRSISFNTSKRRSETCYDLAYDYQTLQDSFGLKLCKVARDPAAAAVDNAVSSAKHALVLCVPRAPQFGFGLVPAQHATKLA